MRRLRKWKWWRKLFPPTPDRKPEEEWTTDDRNYMFGGEHLW